MRMGDCFREKMREKEKEEEREMSEVTEEQRQAFINYKLVGGCESL